MKNLLFIDDDLEILGNYKKLFIKEKDKLDETLELLKLNDKSKNKKPKYNIFTTSQGIDGVEIVRKQRDAKDPICVAFIDMRMPPGIDGCETAKRIREVDDDIEIVVVTAYSDRPLEEIIEAVGTPEKLIYIKKPFESVEIEQLALNLTAKHAYNKTKDAFLENVSHELKTPLNAIMGFTEIIMDNKSIDDEGKRFLDVVLKNSKNMNQMIDDLLTMVRIKERTLTLNIEKVSINNLISSITLLMRPIFQSKGSLELNIELLKEDISISLDGIKINQCLLNLLNNACKFTEQGEVLVKAEQDDLFVTLSVRDNGPGIPEKKRASIFERFSRVEEDHHNIPGLGLGLAITTEIISLHGGKIDVESKEGIGSTFYLRLPISKQEK